MPSLQTLVRKAKCHSHPQLAPERVSSLVVRLGKENHFRQISLLRLRKPLKEVTSPRLG